MSTKTDSVWTPELVQRLRDDHAAGYSTPTIGRRLGVSKNAVVGKSRRIGLDQRENVVGRAIGQEKTEAAQRLIVQGLTAVEIAEKVGIHDETVRGIRKRMGLEAPPRQRKTAVLIVRRSPPRPIQPPRPVVVRPEPRPAPAPLRTDATRTCQYLSGERRRMIACGKPVVLGKSWCPDCYDKVFITKRDRRDVAA